MYICMYVKVDYTVSSAFLYELIAEGLFHICGTDSVNLSSLLNEKRCEKRVSRIHVGVKKENIKLCQTLLNRKQETGTTD